MCRQLPRQAMTSINSDLLKGFHLNGVLFPHFIDQNWLHQIPNYPISPGDLYVVTYPKSGTMWTLQIVVLIQNGSQGKKDRHNTEAILWLELLRKKAYVSIFIIVTVLHCIMLLGIIFKWCLHVNGVLLPNKK